MVESDKVSSSVVRLCFQNQTDYRRQKVDGKRNTKNVKIIILMKRAVDCLTVPYSQEETEETTKSLHYECWKISRE